jgi:hypothetical protein
MAVRSPKLSSDVAGVLICQIEGNRWMVTAGGYAEHRPARTNEELITLGRRECPPDLGRVVSSEVVEDVRTYRYPDSRRRDFHLLERLPARLVAVGDGGRLLQSQLRPGHVLRGAARLLPVRVLAFATRLVEARAWLLRA